MNDYILNITLAKGSGEYCICKFLKSCRKHTDSYFLHHEAHILAPFAHARLPLADRIAEVKVPVIFACTCISLCFLDGAGSCLTFAHRW